MTTASILILLTSLFLGRAVLSICTVLFFVIQIVLVFYNKENNKYFSKNKLLFPITILLLVMISGFVGGFNNSWLNALIVKIPLLIISIAFLLIQNKKINTTAVHIIFVLLVLGSTFYSISIYLLQSSFYENNYHFAKVIPTILDNDHIRFSWCVVIALICNLHLYINTTIKKWRIIISIVSFWFFIFLHILGSKTGLFIVYTSLLIALFLLVKNIKQLSLILLLIITAPIIAYYTIPTFHTRVHYMQYDYKQFKKGNISGLSDGIRTVSMQAGVSITIQNPFTGVGFGQIENKTNDWYKLHTPQLLNYEKILPSSQFLMFSCGTGIIGLCILILVLLKTLFSNYNKRNIYFIIFYIPVLVSFLFEIPLEGQYGVFLFGFFTNWFLLILPPLNVNANATT